MNVASKDLCQELYELSGWSDTDLDSLSARKNIVYVAKQAYELPAYDLGYLLRKLPSHSLVEKGDKQWFAMWESSKYKDPGILADTPEDAACQLLIELIKQKAITV